MSLIDELQVRVDYCRLYRPPTGTLTLFRAPLLGLLPTMLFSDFQNFFLAYVSASRLPVYHLD